MHAFLISRTVVSMPSPILFIPYAAFKEELLLHFCISLDESHETNVSRLAVSTLGKK